MTFDEILEQIIDLLKRQGRVSYRALKRRFNLDDAYLEDIKTELIEAQRLAEDENSRILVWIGAGDVGETTSQPAQPTPQPVTQEQQPLRSHLALLPRLLLTRNAGNSR